MVKSMVSVHEVLKIGPVYTAVFDYLWAENTEGFTSLFKIQECKGDLICSFNHSEAQETIEALAGYALGVFQNLAVVNDHIYSLCCIGFTSHVEDAFGRSIYKKNFLTKESISYVLKQAIVERHISEERRILLDNVLGSLPKIITYKVCNLNMERDIAHNQRGELITRMHLIVSWKSRFAFEPKKAKR